jgi:hypothetical protein
MNEKPALCRLFHFMRRQPGFPLNCDLICEKRYKESTRLCLTCSWGGLVFAKHHRVIKTSLFAHKQSPDASGWGFMG